MFPDRASMYICAIEDREYKDDKINCKFMQKCSKVGAEKKPCNEFTI